MFRLLSTRGLSTAPLRVAVALSGGVDSSVTLLLLSRPCPVLKKRLVEAARWSGWSQLGTADGWDSSDIGDLPLQIVPVHMSNWTDSEGGQFCERSERDARNCEDLLKAIHPAEGVTVEPLTRLTYESEYWVDVFEPFLSRLTPHPSGQITTPNPDMYCNRFVKFGALRQEAFGDLECHVLATGHYAGLDHTRGGESGSMLRAAKDSLKDQSYFLSNVRQSDFEGVVFPLVDLLKNEVDGGDVKDDNGEGKDKWKGKGEDNSDCISSTSRENTVRSLARQYKLPAANVPDSTGICFISPTQTFNTFITEYIPPSSTKKVTFRCIDSGKDLHSIFIEENSKQNPLLLTHGQAIKIGGLPAKYFVVSREYDEDGESWVINAAPGTHHPSLFTTRVFADENDFNWFTKPWVVDQGETQKFQALARVRHLQPLVPCTVKIHKSEIQVDTDYPLRGVVAAQILCLYTEDGQSVIGAGEITNRGKTFFELDIPLPKEIWPSGINDVKVPVPKDIWPSGIDDVKGKESTLG